MNYSRKEKIENLDIKNTHYLFKLWIMCINKLNYIFIFSFSFSEISNIKNSGDFNNLANKLLGNI